MLADLIAQHIEGLDIKRGSSAYRHASSPRTDEAREHNFAAVAKAGVVHLSVGDWDVSQCSDFLLHPCKHAVRVLPARQECPLTGPHIPARQNLPSESLHAHVLCDTHVLLER